MGFQTSQGKLLVPCGVAWRRPRRVGLREAAGGQIGKERPVCKTRPCLCDCTCLQYIGTSESNGSVRLRDSLGQTTITFKGVIKSVHRSRHQTLFQRENYTDMISSSCMPCVHSDLCATARYGYRARMRQGRRSMGGWDPQPRSHSHWTGLVQCGSSH